MAKIIIIVENTSYPYINLQFYVVRFGFGPDGTKVKDIDPRQRIVPHIA